MRLREENMRLREENTCLREEAESRAPTDSIATRIWNLGERLHDLDLLFKTNFVARKAYGKDGYEFQPA